MTVSVFRPAGMAGRASTTPSSTAGATETIDFLRVVFSAAYLATAST